MGVIKKQSIGFTIVNYLGVAVGSLSLILLYPRDEQVYGLFRFLVDVSNMIIPFAMLGMTYVSIRMFPNFRDDKGNHHGFLFLLTSVAFVGSLIVAAIFWQIKDNFIHETQKDAALFRAYLPAIIPIFILFGYSVLLRSYCSNFFKLVFPAMLDQLIKITFPIIFILYISQIIDLEQLVIGIILHFVIMSSASMLYLIWLGKFSLRPDFAFYDKKIMRDFALFSAYGVVGYGSAMLALRMETFMITWLLGDLHQTGSFGISSLIAANIALPLQAVTAVAAPILSKAWAENNLPEIDKIYKKSSENLLVIALFLFGGVCLCLDDLFAIMPKTGDLHAAKMIVYIIGLKSVIDMATGVNDIVIGYSKYFKFNIIAVILLAFVNLLASLYFIPRYGIIGAAIATFISSVLFNFGKFIFLFLQYQLNPYTINCFKSLIISILCFSMVFFIPFHFHPILNILFKGSIFTILFGAMTLRWDVSPDITLVKQQILKKINTLLKK
jgi:O-antigen/teichoic acid export membrane protein